MQKLPTKEDKQNRMNVILYTLNANPEATLDEVNHALKVKKLGPTSQALLFRAKKKASSWKNGKNVSMQTQVEETSAVEKTGVDLLIEDFISKLKKNDVVELSYEFKEGKCRIKYRQMAIKDKELEFS